MSYKIEQNPDLASYSDSDEIPVLEKGSKGDSNVLLLGQTLESMGVTSKLDSAEQLQDLMVSYLQSVGKLSGDVSKGAGNVDINRPKDHFSEDKGDSVQSLQGTNQSVAMLGPIPRLSLFFGESGKGEAP